MGYYRIWGIDPIPHTLRRTCGWVGLFRSISVDRNRPKSTEIDQPNPTKTLPAFDFPSRNKKILPPQSQQINAFHLTIEFFRAKVCTFRKIISKFAPLIFERTAVCFI
jgi:hypothetical protein